MAKKKIKFRKLGRNAGILLTTVTAAVAATAGVKQLEKIPALKMPAKATEEVSGLRDLNFRTLGAKGLVTVGAGIAGVLIPNDFVRAAANGVAIGSAISFGQEAVKDFQKNDLGAVEDFLELFNDDEMGRDNKLEEEIDIGGLHDEDEIIIGQTENEELEEIIIG